MCTDSFGDLAADCPVAVRSGRTVERLSSERQSDPAADRLGQEADRTAAHPDFNAQSDPAPVGPNDLWEYPPGAYVEEPVPPGGICVSVSTTPHLLVRSKR